MTPPTTGDFVGDTQGVTIAVEPCKQHPPFTQWATRNLIQGMCPKCGSWIGDDPKVVRALRARREIERRDRPTLQETGSCDAGCWCSTTVDAACAGKLSADLAVANGQLAAIRARLKGSDWIVCAEALRILDEAGDEQS